MRRTGGLADSVHDTTATSLANNSANGFVFDLPNANELLTTIQRALSSYGNKAEWRQIQQNGMAVDLSWDHSAQEYLNIYRSLM